IAAGVRKLHSSEVRFRRLVESNVIGVIFGEAERLTGANENFLMSTGYSNEDLLAGRLNWKEMTPAEFHHLDQLAGQERRLRRAFAPYEKELFRKDGSRLPVLVGGASFQSGTGSPWVSFVLDLTDRRRTEEALRRSELRFRAIFDQAPLGIAESDLKG